MARDLAGSWGNQEFPADGRREEGPEASPPGAPGMEASRGATPEDPRSGCSQRTVPGEAARRDWKINPAMDRLARLRPKDALQGFWFVA
jgi:hypothetical protein